MYIYYIYIYASVNGIIIGLENGLLLVRRQALTCTFSSKLQTLLQLQSSSDNKIIYNRYYT